MRGWLVVLVAACGSSHPAADSGVTVDGSPHAAVRIIAINDFHGGIDADPTVGPGVAPLAHAIAAQRTPNTVIVSAGDLIGGSPLASGLFHDEPTIDVMNAIGVDLNGVGNHEFDHGPSELLRLQGGGCNAADRSTCSSGPAAPRTSPRT